jgi:hypothetical protein
VETVGEHPVPAGPLAVRWLAYEVVPPRAGVVAGARLVLENAGSATWRSRGKEGVQLAYHWLDGHGNAIVWDGIRTALDEPVAPGQRLEIRMQVRAPIPPGRYRLAFDLVDEHRCWFAEVGSAPLELELDVGRRISHRGLAALVGWGERYIVEATWERLFSLEEPIVRQAEAVALVLLPPGVVLPRDWSSRVLDAHEEGYAAVGGSVEPIGTRTWRRRSDAALAPWAPGTGRNPSFAHPLLCPSVIYGTETTWVPDVEGLPALEPPRDDAWIYDGRIAIKAPLRADRRRG